ncbi:hypothetical protein E2562_020070 [Oryza meyeriana var. granulata]|uniref:Uncharacterized protein n=1 Tax=Oryza meyeriana var. granulata TaxID=110450 RepID=A0A6G1BZ24_9ORYZ|nr:hypothetical protein E2562_020070 [Oryza meyeriana var. granulata]
MVTQPAGERDGAPGRNESKEDALRCKNTTSATSLPDTSRAPSPWQRGPLRWPQRCVPFDVRFFYQLRQMRRARRVAAFYKHGQRSGKEDGGKLTTLRSEEGHGVGASFRQWSVRGGGIGVTTWGGN